MKTDTQDRSGYSDSLQRIDSQNLVLESSTATQPEQTAAPTPESRKSKRDKETPAKGSLVERLAQACNEVGGLEKSGYNEAQRYKYIKAADVAKSIRRELFKRGIVIIPDEIECAQQRVKFKNAKGEERESNECIVRTAYVITDGIDTLTMHGYGIAWDAGDKAIYKAKTGSLKYFLRGLGLIPDEKDDPEADESIDKAVRGRGEETEEEFDQRTADQQAIAPFQITAIDQACKRTGKTEEEVLAYLGLIGHKRIEHVLKSEFQEFLKWANSTPKPKTTATLKPASQIQPPPPTQKAMRKLFAMANDFRIPENDVKRAAYEKFGVKSMTELNVTQLEEMEVWVRDVSEAITKS